ncbi:glycoside hydrolase family 65 protein [Loigolactobacillus backii]|uniref:glycoside hydrolase family 65 protein n=1 Tax=Loigolactobacillus backii TaxID=375175 RepID=UPI0007F0C89F|nr:glycosyl hydrolase family 65 protein [Loigolactobacillus backii]ANK60650.1 kojibiose phosphorylase [Loigolactobacillus backii]
MKVISLRITDDAIILTYTRNNQSLQAIITYDPKQAIGENLEKIRERLVGISFDAAVIENPLEYEFSDTIVGINHQRIDIGLALTNMLNIPVVSQQTVKSVGLEKAVARKQDYNQWHLDYYGQYTSKRNYGQESMLTIGNGFFGLRGSYVEATADQDNYPGTYIAGFYNQNTTKINDRDVVNEDLVNLPNAQFLTFGVDQQRPFTVTKENVQDIYRSLDLHTGELRTTMLIQLATGHVLRIVTTKVADMKNWHQYAIRYQLTPINFSGSLQVYSKIDGSVTNDNVERYQNFDQHHIDISEMSTAGAEAYLAGHTKTSNIDFIVGTKFTSSSVDTNRHLAVTNTDDAITQTITLDVEQNKTYTFEKNVAMFTSQETQGSLMDHATKELQNAGFDSSEQNSNQFWQGLWSNADIQIEGDLTSQKLTRVNTFHMFVSASSTANPNLDASVGARGLHGEAYRGHVFWDEMFVIPYYTQHYPKLARQLLMYRYNRLGAAKKYAASEGYKGAMYPWQSGMYGDEQSQFVHLNPITKSWDPDNSRLQRHVSLSVAYNIWTYYHMTNDVDFMNQYGLEMLLEISRFWISKAIYNEKTKRYTIKKVMGPDEFHEGYPNSDEEGLTNNAYTNIMVAWLFKTVEELRKDTISAATFKEVTTKVGFDEKLFAKMDKISHHLKLDINEDGIIGQFEGYFKLPTLNFENYRKKYGDISRMDRILKAEGRNPDAYQVAKQADTLMAFYNFDFNSVNELIKGLGYKLPKEYLTKNIEYYLDRTTHGSTLSRIVYAVLSLIDGNMDQSWKLFSQALLSDYYDIQGGTTAEGIHLGVMGATLLLETRNYAGVDQLTDQVKVNPHLPSHWQSIAFKQFFRGTQYSFKITHDLINVTADHDTKIYVAGKEIAVPAGKATTVTYQKPVNDN